MRTLGQILIWYELGQIKGVSTPRSALLQCLDKKYSGDKLEQMVEDGLEMYRTAQNSRRKYAIYVYRPHNGKGQKLIACRQVPIIDPPDKPDRPTSSNPKIKTSAALSTGGKSVDNTVTTFVSIIDTVNYSGFKNISSGTLKGWVIQKSTGGIIAGTETSIPVTIGSASGTLSMTFNNIDISGFASGDGLVVFEEFYDASGKLIASHKDKNSSSQTITVTKDGEEPPIPVEPSDINQFYFGDTSVETTVIVTKTDIETGKPLEGVEFYSQGDVGGVYTTDSNGSFAIWHTETFTESAESTAKLDNHEVTTGHHSDGSPIKETKYYYVCNDCGSQSGDYDSESSAKTAGEEHCHAHAVAKVEAALDADVAAYRYYWLITETYPRTSNHSSSLVTGGSDSYTTGYHNNPVITKSNTESGYHREEDRIINVNLTNERVRGTITINKSDMDYLNCRTEGDNNQDFIPQGDSSLAGAVYGLYANADIIRPDGKSDDRTGLPCEHQNRLLYCSPIPPVHFVHPRRTS